MHRVPLTFLFVLVALLPACGSETEEPPAPRIVTETVAYEHDGVELEGYLAYDASRTGKRPGILVIHEWWGLTDHPKERARRLAGLGYVAFCADMYGKGKVTDDPEQAGAWASAFRDDRKGFGRARLRAGYDVLARHERVDASKLGAMGFCYGGTVALEAAWTGWPLAGAVCFHGNLTTPAEDEAEGVQAAVLVCNGAADAWVGPDQVEAFRKAMEAHGIEHDVESYEGAVHAFTNPGADAHGIDNVAYHKAADEKSWAAMKAFWAKHLGP